jgi:hypothetical protein
MTDLEAGVMTKDVVNESTAAGAVDDARTRQLV